MAVLRVLLWLLPREFRREYGAEVLHTAAEQWREMGASLSAWGSLRFWVRQWLAAARVGADLRRGRGIIGGADKQADRPYYRAY